jgi:hypothetical protein
VIEVEPLSPQESIHRWENLRNQFQLVGALEARNRRLIWTANSETSKLACTYVVVMEPGLKGQRATILYVGMAGNGWNARAAQHNGGLNRVFDRKVTGIKHWNRYQERLDWLETGHTIKVYQRTSDTIMLFGVQVTIQHAEETALIHCLNPEHNVLRPKRRNPDLELSVI